MTILTNPYRPFTGKATETMSRFKITFDNNTYTFIKSTTLSDTERTDIKNLYHSCTNYDSHDYYFCTVEEDLDSDAQYSFPLYYLCYDAALLTGVISLLPDDASVCIYSLTHPDYRRKHIFSKMFEIAIDDLSAAGITPVEIHLYDSKNIPPHIFSILSGYGFKLHHQEYLMEYNFPENPLPVPASQCELEAEYDEDTQEFSLWIGDNYIGGCNIYISNSSPDINSLKSTACVTFYGYEILEKYRGKGYGYQGFLLILDMLNAMKVTKMILHVSGENKKAHNIYVRCGLKVQSSFSVYRLSLEDLNQENRRKGNS